MPSLETVRGGIRRARQGNVLVAPQPVDRTFAIPAPYTTMENGDRHLRFDNNVDGRILIFGTNESAGDWFMDGTFTVAPPQFTQLYTMHGLSRNHYITGCYALLPNKTREMYMELLQQVSQLTNGFQPQSMMTDYEQAGISAIPNVYPNTSVFGCLFHLSQSNFREVRGQGLQQQFHTDEVFQMMIAALAFVSMDGHFTVVRLTSLNIAWETNKFWILLKQIISANFDEDGGGTQGSHTIYGIFIGALYWIFLEQTNMLEGWHKSFNASVSIAHPTIWRFISILRHDAGRDSTITSCMIYRWKCTRR